ncbi:MAG TPA: thiamine pyrophosphate-binding protein [Pseudomonas sp.]|uniref:thiamine pyrophosphate-binding protein n=1 Tax=Pseudomonas sp. TaxID=306 RepID=UPI002ED9FE3F
MSKAATQLDKHAMPASRARRLWLKWRFHLNILLLLIPLGFMPQYFRDMALFRGDGGLGERIVGDVQVGPWSLTLAEAHDEAPEAEAPGVYVKEFNAALCDACIPQIKAGYLRVGKPRSLRAAGAILEGSPYRMGVEVALSTSTNPQDDLWITLEGWDGTVHQTTLSLAKASPKTVEWLKTQGDRP